MSKLLYCVGLSGGKDSTAAFLFMLNETNIPHEQIIALFCNTHNETKDTYAHIEMLKKFHAIETLEPELGFYDLAKKKKRFPSTRARFCTQALKIEPTRKRIAELVAQGFDVISVSGVRAQESEARAQLLEHDFDFGLGCKAWRPLIAWTLEDVKAIHKKYNVPLNPMYAKGATRVGCAPCIMSRKSEIRMMAREYPEIIDAIRKTENDFPNKHGFSSFYSRTKVPEQFRTKEIVANDGRVLKVPTIDDVVTWSRNGDNEDFEAELFGEDMTCDIEHGYCE